MKFLLIILTSFFLTLLNGESKRAMLCHQWTQVAFKANGSKKPKPCASGACKTVEFFKDGNYEEALFHGTTKGKWIFNSDSTKFGENVTESNGVKIKSMTTIETNIEILKLTDDSLIYGVEGYYGSKQVPGRDDWYFVKAK